ncbi:MAG: GNAT family N-acetyltransferase [Dehalococcoidales bacterium]|jgi:GNAT superfamily N-acetyltransferase
MKNLKDVKIKVNPTITPEQLFAFYRRNHICEEGYGKEKAARPLSRSSLIVGAFWEEELVGIARAMFDGLSAAVMEFCVDLAYQGKGIAYENGSLIGGDESGLGKKLGETLVNELFRIGADFISIYIFGEYEAGFYQSLGFEPLTGHSAYYIDKRPYRRDERYITRRRD